jgi:hypothetical protein
MGALKSGAIQLSGCFAVPTRAGHDVRTSLVNRAYGTPFTVMVSSSPSAR